MARRVRTSAWVRLLQRPLERATRKALKAGTKAMLASMQPQATTPRARRTSTAKKSASAKSGLALTTAGARHFTLHKPPGVRAGAKLPLVVMLHGCGQDAASFAASTRMNRIADRERFLVLYPEQERLSHPQRCWHWYDTRSGRAQAEVRIVLAALDQVCATQPVAPDRIAIAGFSAGAGLAALLATLHPERFRAVAMHSGVAPGFARSIATALAAMRGERTAPGPASSETKRGVAEPATTWPPLLVIQGLADRVVAASNGAAAARLWAEHEDAIAGPTRRVQRGARLAAAVTTWDSRAGRLVATLCEIERLGHAWSGGAASERYSNPKGPDASRMIWSFFKKRFAGDFS